MSPNSPPGALSTALHNIQSQPQDPNTWHNLVRKHDPGHRFVVTEVGLYREENNSWFYIQHEYAILIVEPRPATPQPATSASPGPANDPGPSVEAEAPSSTSTALGPGPDALVVKAARPISGNHLAARLAFWGTATDTITVLGAQTDVEVPSWDICDYRFIWPLANAPTLADVSGMMESIHDGLPTHVILRGSSHAFARAIVEAVQTAYEGTLKGGTYLVHDLYSVRERMAAKRAHAAVMHVVKEFDPGFKRRYGTGA